MTEVEKRYKGNRLEKIRETFPTGVHAINFPLNLYPKQIELIKKAISTGLFGNMAQVIRYAINNIIPKIIEDVKVFFEGEYIKTVDGKIRKLISIQDDLEEE